MIIVTTKFNILISVWMALTIIQGHSCIRKKSFGVHFLANPYIDLDEIQYVVTTSWFVEDHAAQVIFKGENSADVI